MNRIGMISLALCAVLISLPKDSNASVGCTKLPFGSQQWHCIESQQNSTIGYGWSVAPTWLGTLRIYPGANVNFEKLFFCGSMDNIVINGQERQATYDGRVKVVRQFGVNLGPLSQSVSEASVHCVSPGPTMNADSNSGDWVIDLEFPGAFDDEIVLCGGGPATTVYEDLEVLIVMCGIG